LWAIHAVRLETRIHRKPSPSAYQETINLASDQLLTPAFAPELASSSSIERQSRNKSRCLALLSRLDGAEGECL
jgi:hypothetical protein